LVVVVVVVVVVIVVAAATVVVAAVALLMTLQPIRYFVLSCTLWALDQGLLYLCYELPVKC
jgi:hypothetical protein